MACRADLGLGMPMCFANLVCADADDRGGVGTHGCGVRVARTGRLPQRVTPSRGGARHGRRSVAWHRRVMRPSIAELLADGGPLVLPGVYDALSARLAHEAGCRAVFLSGFAMAATRLGRPDFGLLTQSEVLEAARAVCAAVVPVVVDIDTGYGGVFNVERTVAALLQVGAAGCFLEDQEWPKRCGHMRASASCPSTSTCRSCARPSTCARRRGFHVTARTDAAPPWASRRRARARAFADAGADAVFIEAPQSVDEMTRVRAAVPASVPLVANMVEQGKTPLRPAAELAAAGHPIVVIPVAGVLSAAHALRAVYGAIARDGASGALADRMTGFAELNELLGLADYYRREAGWRR